MATWWDRQREVRQARLDRAAEKAVDRLAADRAASLDAGPSNFSRASVPWAFDLAAAWSWRLIVVAVAGYGILWLLSFFAVVVLPLLVAVFTAALVAPVVQRLERVGVRRRFGALLVVILGIGLLVLLLSFVGNQIANGIDDLSAQVSDGLGQVRDWLRTGPLGLTDNELQNAIGELQDRLKEYAGGDAVTLLGEVGATVGHLVAAAFIILFGTYFFLADGARIWTWLVRLTPRAARERVDSSGRVAWRSLTQFTRATVLVAGTDAIGIALGAYVLGVPFVSAIGVLVFLGAFVPLLGATVSGAVAVLVALVAVGLVKALIMLGVIIFIQQLEAHVLQPFLMGRFVSVHPLGVIVAIACGVLVAGIAGALLAVPTVAVLNAVGQHLAAQTDIGDSVEESARHDPDPPPAPA